MSKPFSTLIVENNIVSPEILDELLQKQSARNVSLSSILLSESILSRPALREFFQKHMFNMYLGDLLLESGIVTNPDYIQDALEYQKHKDVKLGEALVELGFLTHEDLINGLCQQTNTIKVIPEPELAQDFKPMPSVRFQEENLVLPYYKDGQIITIVMADPFDYQLVERVKSIYEGYNVEIAYSEKDDLLAFFNSRRVWESDKKEKKKGSKRVVADIRWSISLDPNDREMTENVKTFQIYLRKALDLGASDMHIEPMQSALLFRFAIDGMLQTITQVPISMAPSISAMIKVAAGIDITKRMLPGDGRISVMHRNVEYDLRVSTYPCLHGENVVIRILKKTQGLDSVNDLGFSPANLKKFRLNLLNPSGITIVTGPTGSGKTTSLYSSMLELAAPGNKHIITIEDPVEYRLEGLTQASLNEAQGFDYTTALTSILRQNPDIIMVGEIRDKKAAYAVIQAALTGHKVFTTFHTENSTGALARLIDMGVENFLISETVVFVVAQRLARMICPECVDEYKPDMNVINAMNIPDFNPSDHTFFRGTGRVGGRRCDNCSGAGYKGRIGVHEVLSVSESVSKAILEMKQAHQIRETAKRDAGLLTLKEDVMYKIMRGYTTFEEALRVIPHISEGIRPFHKIMELSEDAPYTFRPMDKAPQFN